MNAKYMLKIIAAGLAAFAILNVLCIAYYNDPLNFVSKTGATDYTAEKDAYYSRMSEGFGYGRTNNEGYFNLANYDGQRIDILLMGSSHIEGKNVPLDKTTAAVLNELLGPQNMYAYNIGFSNHSFPRNINNMEAAVQFYNPKKYVVIETASVEFDVGLLEKSLDKKLERLPPTKHIENSRFLLYVRKLPYLSLLHRRFLSLIRNNSGDDDSEGNFPGSGKTQYAQVLGLALKNLSESAESANVKIIIFYHPHFVFNDDGTISANDDDGYLGLFEDACNAENIIFINMADEFIREYENNRRLPHGFGNSAAGAGHLNKNGHRTIARKLAGQIILLENNRQNQ